MAEHVWTVLCRRAVQDKETNNLSMFDTLEHLGIIRTSSGESPQPNQWSPIPYEAVLVSLVTRSNAAIPERSKLKVEICAPNGEIWERHGINDLDLTNSPRARSLIQFMAIPFRENGVHRFVVSLGDEGRWTKVAEVPLKITVEALPAPSAAPSKKARRPRKSPKGSATRN